MDFVSIVILSLVEGITEFLPISSTGHLILTTKLLQIEQTDSVTTFLITIQLGAILAVVFHSFRIVTKNVRFVPKIIAAFVPTGVIGLLTYPFIKSFLLNSELITLIMLFLGGILLMFIDKVKYIKNSKNINLYDLSYTKCITIGTIQSLSIIPGVSRAASSIIGGMVLGLEKKSAVEFSFLLAIPTMLAATGYDLMQNIDLVTRPDTAFELLLGTLLSFVVALFAIKWLLRYVERHSFFAFGVYRVIFSLIFALFLYHNLFI